MTRISTSLAQQSKELQQVIEFTYKKLFPTRGGLPFAKKMWRDGYNKALQDVRYFILSGDSSAEPDPEATDKP